MAESTKTTIGKDVIESLTLGMYEDSRSVYREYIQNSADQIDKAVKTGILDKRDDGRIEITINQSNRSISIYDNATGIKSNEVGGVLKNIAQSGKDRAKDKGFRGIGRLGGLAYCDKLVFETSFKGENKKTTLVWDACELKRIINNRLEQEEAAEVVDAVTSIRFDTEESGLHYFKVTLDGVPDEKLLSKSNVSTYLSMVAPVPYNKGFLFRGQIHDELAKINLGLDEYNISVNTDQIFKAYTTRIYEGEEGSKKRIDDITDLQYFTVKEENDGLLGWGWYGISAFTKQIPAKGNVARGIRLRKGNIQIGSDNCLVNLFKETRGSYYFFGEVHAFHKDLIPNARRDYFLDNEVMRRFEAQLESLFHTELHGLYYFASNTRSKQKHIDELDRYVEEYKEKQEKGFTSNEDKDAHEEKFSDLKNKAKAAAKELGKVADALSENKNNPKNKIFNRIVTGKTESAVDEIELQETNKGAKTRYITDDLNALTRKEKKLVSKIFGVIDNALPKDLADNLKEKIKESLK